MMWMLNKKGQLKFRFRIQLKIRKIQEKILKLITKSPCVDCMVKRDCKMYCTKNKKCIGYASKSIIWETPYYLYVDSTILLNYPPVEEKKIVAQNARRKLGDK